MPAEPPKPQRVNMPNPANYSSPSVPISVYKQLAGELNLVKGEVAALKSENQQLRSNNQKLQNQVHQVIQAAEHLKHMVNRYDFGAETYNLAPATPPPIVAPQFAQPQLPKAVPPTSAPQQPQQFSANFSGNFPAPSQQIPPQNQQNGTAQPSLITDNAVYPQSPAQKPAPLSTNIPPAKLPTTEEVEGGVNGWVIFLAAIAIILTAFGAGYMVVLLLLNNNNNPNSN
jgi:hypothetical protein